MVWAADASVLDSPHHRVTEAITGRHSLELPMGEVPRIGMGIRRNPDNCETIILRSQSGPHEVIWHVMIPEIRAQEDIETYFGVVGLVRVQLRRSVLEKQPNGRISRTSWLRRTDHIALAISAKKSPKIRF
jgi:hypothetical protein